MKKLISFFVVALFIISLIACSSDPPSVRVYNQRTTKANVQFKQANGNTINHNDVAASTYSNYQEVAEGAIQVTAVIQNETVSPTANFNASKDKNYTVVILGGATPSLRVDESGK